MAIPSAELTATQESRLARARVVTEEQVEIAKQIASKHGVGQDVLGAIIQALATNYAATVDASKK